MTTTRLERLTRQAVGTHTPASPGPARESIVCCDGAVDHRRRSGAAAVRLRIESEQQYQTDAANLSETTSGLGQTQVLGNMWFTGP